MINMSNSIKDEFLILRELLSTMSICAKEIEKSCIMYGELKAKLQLEIYKLLKNNDDNAAIIAKVIAEHSANNGILNTIDVPQIKTKFFKEK